MRIQKLLKPFLAASTLGTCAYYFNHKTKSLFLRECLEENKQTSFLINRNKDLSSPLKKEKISSDNSISDNKLLPIKDKVITPYEENKLHNIIMLVNEKTTSDVEGYHKLFWRLSGEYLEAYKNQTDSEMLMRLAVIYEIGSAAYVFYKDHVENVERAFELRFGAYILRIKGGGHNHPDTKESRKILIAKSGLKFFQVAESYNELVNCPSSKDNLYKIPLIASEDNDALMTLLAAQHRGNPLYDDRGDLKPLEHLYMDKYVDITEYLDSIGESGDFAD